MIKYYRISAKNIFERFSHLPKLSLCFNLTMILLMKCVYWTKLLIRTNIDKLCYLLLPVERSFSRILCNEFGRLLTFSTENCVEWAQSFFIYRLNNWSIESWKQKDVIAVQRCSVENQKGAITIQICSVENQKGVITIQICSVENQKGAIIIQRCSVENQTGAMAIYRLQCTVIAPSYSQRNIFELHQSPSGSQVSTDNGPRCIKFTFERKSLMRDSDWLKLNLRLIFMILRSNANFMQRGHWVP